MGCLSIAVGMSVRLIPRRKTFRRGNARIRADSARFRADPPTFRQKKNSSELRRTSGERPADTARIRADPCGLRRELAELFAEKNFRQKNLSSHHRPRRKDVHGERPSAADGSAADELRPRTIPRVRFKVRNRKRVRARVRVEVRVRVRVELG